MRTATIVLGLLTCLAVTGCGSGDGGSKELTGKVTVPSGYVLYRGNGVSFAYPQGWKVDASTGGDGSPTVAITSPSDTQTPAPLIQLTLAPGAGDRFDSFADQRRVVIEQANDAKVDSSADVELAGSKKALRTTATFPKGAGNAPVEVKSTALQAVTPANAIVVLSAAVPQRGDGGLDAAAVIDSFRFEQSS